jgi:hypothetical protein
MRSRRTTIGAAALILLALALACSRGGTKPQAPAPEARKAEPAPQPPPAPKPPVETERSVALTANARLLAGLKADAPGPWAALQERPSWKTHAKALGSLWKAHDDARLSRVRRWAATHLNTLEAPGENVFYPFGGPDALYPTAFFPDASAFTLVGLEPVGAAPDLTALTEKQFDGTLKEMDLYVTPILQISFFRTNDMEVELAERGTLPILMTFLAGTGYRILDVEMLALSASGTFEPPDGGKAKAARITFLREGAATPQTLTYISQDLSEAGLKDGEGFKVLLGNLGRHVTFLKAASYLMHRPSFATIRSAILDGSDAVLQDDSGIPLKYFASDRWALSFFGTYTGPIKLFQSFTQKDLVEAYHGSGSVAPLDFGIGYRHHAGESNLMLAVRRPGR